MAAYIVRRLILALMTVSLISFLAFVIIELPPGDAVERWVELEMVYNGREPSLDQKQAMRLYFGIDKPMVYRYGKWVWGLMNGDLGQSLAYRQNVALPVKEVIGNRLWLTAVLTGFTIIVTWSFAIPIGIYSAVRQHSLGDYAFTLLGFTGIAVPDFLLGLVLMYVSFAYFGKSVGGLFSADFGDAPWSLAKTKDLLDHLWVPAVVLGTSGTASLIRILRNNLLDELGKPYVVTARAKGVHPFRLVLKYPVRVAINPLVSTVGYLLPALVSGSVIVSVVLSLPTLGPVLLEGIRGQDSYLAGFIILMFGTLTVIGTFISDILLAVVDPRIKLTR